MPRKNLIRTADEIKLMEDSSRIVAEVLSMLEKYVKPGVETIELDKIAEDYILSKGGRPAFKGYGDPRNPFPGTLCISIDDVVVHGIPGSRKLREGEIVSLDCGVEKLGFFGDSAVTYGVGEVSEDKKKLMKVTEEALMKGIAQACSGKKVFDISGAVQKHCESNGYSLTRDLVGHGVGKRLHEEPPIPNFVPALLYRNQFPNMKLMNGMGLAIEPMVHMGKKEVYTSDDGWTVHTVDNSPSAHFEHTVVVNDNNPIILTIRE